MPPSLTAGRAIITDPRAPSSALAASHAGPSVSHDSAHSEGNKVPAGAHAIARPQTRPQAGPPRRRTSAKAQAPSIAAIFWRVARLTGTSTSSTAAPKRSPGLTPTGPRQVTWLAIGDNHEYAPARMICPCCPRAVGWRPILADPVPATTCTGRAGPFMIYPLPKASHAAAPPDGFPRATRSRVQGRQDPATSV